MDILDEGIYCSVPNEAMQEVSIDRNIITEFLKRTPGTFYTAKQLANLTGYPTKGTQPELRKAITQLISLDGVPIVANSKGFGYPNSQHMIEHYIGQLEERKQGLQRRINHLREIVTRWH